MQNAYICQCFLRFLLAVVNPDVQELEAAYQQNKEKKLLIRD
jgi:hypothetical protein